MSAVQEPFLKSRLRFDWGWWTLANIFAATIGLLLSSLISFYILFSLRLDLLKIRDIAIILGLATLILGAITALTQWIILKRQRFPKPLLLSLINTTSAIVTYTLLTWLSTNALWRGDWKPILASVFVGALLGAATGKVIDRYCFNVELRLAQETDEYWEELAWQNENQD